jgi:mannose-1-phosphate guanylyltransferase
MKAILLAAGYGTRLKPITDFIPKCLVPIKGKPLLEIWIDKLITIGIKEILINSHYKNEMVEAYIKNSVYKKQITLVYEPKLVGTAGTIINNQSFIENDEVLLIHADNYTLDNFDKFIISHKNRDTNCLMSMMAFRTNQPENCGIIKMNKRNILTNFYEKSNEKNGNLANAAVYILTPTVISFIKKNNYSDFSNQVIPNLIRKINIYETENYYIDIGTIENFLTAQYF